MTSFIKILACLTPLALAACGGGDDGSKTSQAGGGNCPSAQTSDVWMDQRLGCLQAGQPFIDMSAGYVKAGTATGDRAYVLNQGVYDKQFNNILGTASDFRRYWAHFVCVRNAPLIPGGSGFHTGLAADLQTAMRLGPFSSDIPADVGATTLGQYGGNRSGWADTSCNAAIHPLIVNYTTGAVESINPAAVGATQTYTLP